MNRKILLIGNTTSRSVLRLRDEANRLGITFDVIKPAEISLEGDELIVQTTQLSLPPLEYDTYFFRGINKSRERMQVIAQFLVSKNKRVCEKIFPISGLPEDKHVQESQQGLYHIPEQLIIPAQDITASTVTEFPVVVKKLSSSLGKGVAKVSSVPELLSFVLNTEEQIIIQKYYPIDFDIRVLIVGDKVLGAMERLKPEGEAFLTTRRGGKRNPIELTKAMRGAALEAKKLQGLEIAGVDLFIYEDKIYILEVNASPQFTVFEFAMAKNPGALVNVAREILEYLMRGDEQ